MYKKSYFNVFYFFIFNTKYISLSLQPEVKARVEKHEAGIEKSQFEAPKPQRQPRVSYLFTQFWNWALIFPFFQVQLEDLFYHQHFVSLAHWSSSHILLHLKKNHKSY